MTKQLEIQKLKVEKDAVILAHYYVRPEVQEIADCIGDSYFLSRKAVEMPNRTIVFCGVSFMGESAKLLNPDKTVLMPGAYGYGRNRKKGKAAVRGFGCGVLHQLYGGNKVVV